jgi:uncharacterized RDD family membrane protein YckC
MNSTPNSPPPNPFAPPTAVVSDKPLESDLRASRGARFGAAFLDGIIAMVIVYGPLLIFGGLSTLQAVAATGSSRFAVYGNIANATGGGIVIAALVALLVINLYLLHKSGQSIGKKLVGIHITRTDGSKASLARIVFVRDLPFIILGVIPFIQLVAWFVDPLFIFGEGRRCLHDLLADTIVVND